MSANRVIVFFGEMGSGKSYTGAQFAAERCYEFFEGDSVVTRELLDRSGRFKPIPRGVIREFVKVRVPFIRHVRNLLTRKPKGWRWVLYMLANKPFFQKPAGRAW